MIAIIDYDAGNIKSVEKAVMKLGGSPVLTRDPHVLEEADRVILPGVGAFGDAVEKLHHFGLFSVIKQIADSGKPLLGICLGEQLLFESSEESPGTEGLAILKGDVRRIHSEDGDDKSLKIPNIGWNSLDFPRPGRLFEGIEEGAFVYFVHSYYVHAFDRSVVRAVIRYGTEIDASVESGNIFACQFHPEKSSDVGLKILNNFLSIA
ncbi:MAG: imidazole glycerol phosphate synthase subunit HisH [Lachnospiraceae bacterium]|nr:imidazole glycerol phosphate synthase subunit HisH [Lachnospiraceae bacterium]